MHIAYLVGAHVASSHIILPRLIESMMECGISPSQILVTIAGAGKARNQIAGGVTYLLRQPDFLCSFQPIVEEKWGERMGITHWFFLNGTSRCGSDFRRLVSDGANEEADVTIAGDILPLASMGSGGRAICDLALYRDEYLLSRKEIIFQTTLHNGTEKGVVEYEGVLFALAPKKAKYPKVGHVVLGEGDFYGTGIMRRHEYYPGIDWHRYKRNHGQLKFGSYDPAMI